MFPPSTLSLAAHRPTHLLGTESHVRQHQHEGAVLSDEAPQHEHLRHQALAGGGGRAEHQVAAAQHAALVQALRLQGSAAQDIQGSASYAGSVAKPAHELFFGI